MAITYVNSIDDNTNTGGADSLIFPGAVATGDLLIAMINIIGTTTNIFPTVSDTLGNSWNLPSQLHFFTSQQSGGFFLEMVMAWTKVTAPGTPTINFAGMGSGNIVVSAAQYTGFATNNPGLATADITTNQGTSAAPSGTGFSNTFTNELSIAFLGCDGGQNIASISGSFTARQGVGSGTPNYCFGDVIKATSGNAITFGASITSNRWGVMLASFADSVPTNSAPLYWTS